jgi:hypothetical protein
MSETVFFAADIMWHQYLSAIRQMTTTEILAVVGSQVSDCRELRRFEAWARGGCSHETLALLACRALVSQRIGEALEARWRAENCPEAKHVIGRIRLRRPGD